MENSYQNFTRSLEKHLTDFLWQQWSTLGVLGTSSAEDRWVIDPEALLLLTSELGRHEPRLFDEVMDWLRINSRWINTQRLRSMHTQYGIGDAHVLSAIARVMLKHDPPTKWAKLVQMVEPLDPPQALFRLGRRPLLSSVEEPDPDFKAIGLLRQTMSTRSLSQAVLMKHPSALQFRLRSLFGLGMRADILCYLLSNESSHPSGIAQSLGYSQKRVQDTMNELAESGMLNVRTSGRMKIYWLYQSQWMDFLSPRNTEIPRWIHWRHLARGLTTLWRGIWSIDPQLADDYIASSKMRSTMREAKDDLHASGIGFDIEDDREYLAENYLPVFTDNIQRILGTHESP